MEIYNLELVSNNIALFVTLSQGECQGRFSENGFHITKPVKNIQFLSKDYLNVEELQNCISVRQYNKI